MNAYIRSLTADELRAKMESDGALILEIPKDFKYRLVWPESISKISPRSFLEIMDLTRFEFGRFAKALVGRSHVLDELGDHGFGSGSGSGQVRSSYDGEGTDVGG
jgi:hypothetical protein